MGSDKKSRQKIAPRFERSFALLQDGQNETPLGAPQDTMTLSRHIFRFWFCSADADCVAAGEFMG